MVWRRPKRTPRRPKRPLRGPRRTKNRPIPLGKRTFLAYPWSGSYQRPRRLDEPPISPQDGPRGPPEGFKTAQEAPGLAQRAPRLPKRGPRGPKKAPKRNPRGPWEAPKKANGGPQEGRRWLQKAPRGPKLPKTTQGGPRTAQEGSKTDQKSPRKAQTAFSYDVHQADPNPGSATKFPEIRCEPGIRCTSQEDRGSTFEDRGSKVKDPERKAGDPNSKFEDKGFPTVFRSFGTSGVLAATWQCPPRESGPNTPQQ